MTTRRSNHWQIHRMHTWINKLETLAGERISPLLLSLKQKEQWHTFNGHQKSGIRDLDVLHEIPQDEMTAVSEGSLSVQHHSVIRLALYNGSMRDRLRDSVLASTKDWMVTWQPLNM